MDLKSHPTDEQLERFVLGRTSEIRTMRRHP